MRALFAKTGFEPSGIIYSLDPQEPRDRVLPGQRGQRVTRARTPKRSSPNAN